MRHSSDALWQIGETKQSSDRPRKRRTHPRNGVTERSQNAYRRGVYTFAPLNFKLGVTEPKFTKFYQIFTQCSQIIADEPFETGIAIFHSIGECQGEE